MSTWNDFKTISDRSPTADNGHSGANVTSTSASHDGASVSSHLQARDSAEATIEMRGVRHVFPSDHGPMEALRGVDLTVSPGEFLAIVGRSGCGKSTLLRLIAGLLRPTDGTIVINGQQVQGPDPRTSILFQSPVLLPWRTVIDNVLLPLQLRHGKVLDSDIEEGRRLLEMANIADFEKARPSQLSGGMQQRVALARALVSKPSILLMDEPFGALDALTRERMNLELQSLWMKSRPSVVFVTHDIDEAMVLSDRIVVLSPRPGRMRDIVEVGFHRPRDLGIESMLEYIKLKSTLREMINAES